EGAGTAVAASLWLERRSPCPLQSRPAYARRRRMHDVSWRCGGNDCSPARGRPHDGFLRQLSSRAQSVECLSYMPLLRCPWIAALSSNSLQSPGPAEPLPAAEIRKIISFGLCLTRSSLLALLSGNPASVRCVRRAAASWRALWMETSR